MDGGGSTGRTIRRVRSWPGRRTVAAVAGSALPDLAGGRMAQLPVAISFWDGSCLPARNGAPQGPPANGNGPPDDPPVVVARSPRAVSHFLYHPGELGLARAWVDGSLTVRGNPQSVLALRRAFTGLDLSTRDRMRLALLAVRVAGPGVLRSPPAPSIEAAVRGQRHSLSRDRTSVRHHYDLSNDFYRLVLGPSLVYSCAYFSSPEDSLEQAQERKLDLICRKLALEPGERLLDIGCGWGSLVLHAAAHYGVRAVGVTLSEPQAALARARAVEQGLQDRVEIRVADYRELTDGPFDKIASIGMYEHVGRAQLGNYVGKAYELLTPGGLFLNHGIARLAAPPPTADTFISRYIFPDGELHPVADLIQELEGAEFEVRDLESLREHYPVTLRRWADNLADNITAAADLVGAERVRAWQVYMLGCAQAFEDGDITVFQVVSARGGAPHRLPLDRTVLLHGEHAGTRDRD
jgi:cyclopropane-fatty-acyl-phospholipid synthase